MVKARADIYHSRKKKTLHNEVSKKTSICPFCNLADRAIHETPTMTVIENKVFYDWWDEAQVTEHLMLIPKRHVETVSGLDPAEREEYLDIIAKYENRDYSFYSRAPDNGARTQPHLHTHLIKTDKTKDRFMLIIRDLGIRFVR